LNQGEDIGGEPVWFTPVEPEPTPVVDPNVRVARTSKVLVRPGRMEEVRELYEGPIQKMYQSSRGFCSAQLLLDPATYELFRAHAGPRMAEADPNPLLDTTKTEIEALFKKMDLDGDGKLTKDEAQKHFKKFSKISANAMFKEVDEDESKDLTLEEFNAFFKNVMLQKKEDSEEYMYSDEDVLETVKDLQAGEAWVDFLDGRSTTAGEQ